MRAMSKGDGQPGGGSVVRHAGLWGASLVFVMGAVACSSDSPSSPPASPSSGTGSTTPTVVTVAVSGPGLLEQQGATGQFVAKATLTNGAVEDRTNSATWLSDNTNVASVSSAGLVTARGDGSATISATVSGQRGSAGLTVRLPRRTPDPAAGQILPLPDVSAFVRDASAKCPSIVPQSCPNGVKYVNNPWQDCIIDQLRTLDTRWGYNAKPTRTPADNGGLPVVAAGDEIAYHYGTGPDEGSTDVHLVDILVGHCGASPSLGWRVFTGEEPGRWTGARRF